METTEEQNIQNALAKQKREFKEKVKRLKEELCKEMLDRPNVKWSKLDRVSQPEIMNKINSIMGDFEE
jgi:hypothetical protein